jgi:Tfp pilus assembly protein PilV
METMFASAVLAMSVLAISSVTASSYQQEQHAQDRARASALASQTIEELCSLPFDTYNGTTGLISYDCYSDKVRMDSSTGSKRVTAVDAGSATPTTQVTSANAVSATLNDSTALISRSTSGVTSLKAVDTTTATAAATVAEAPLELGRSVMVQRLSSINGATSATGNLALVTVVVKLPDGSTLTQKRLVSSIN